MQEDMRDVFTYDGREFHRARERKEEEAERKNKGKEGERKRGREGRK